MQKRSFVGEVVHSVEAEEGCWKGMVCEEEGLFVAFF